jgi:hypothetical protein
MPRTVFFDDNDKPRLVQSYCVFADFLGFRQQIQDSVKNGEEQAIFKRFMEEIEPEIENTINPGPEDDIEGFPRMWDAKVFTDNVVLGYSLWSDRGEKEFGHAITQLLEFQYAVAMKGFFVRGGWAVGNLFMNRNTVFGAALIEAYDLESQVAKHPRIVLSETMRGMVFMHMARYSSDPPQCLHLLVDEKGILFTNYLSEAIVDGEVQWHELRRHADLVAERLAQFEGNEAVYAKYLWLAGYHNFFCGLVSKGEGYTDDLRVSVDVPSFGIHELLHDDSPYVADVRAASIELETRRSGAKRRNGGDE